MLLEDAAAPEVVAAALEDVELVYVGLEAVILEDVFA